MSAGVGTRVNPEGAARAVRRVALADVTGPDLAAWHDLAQRAAEPNPWFEAALLLPAGRHLAPADVQLLVVLDGDRWLGALPVQATSRWRRIPAATLGTWRHTHCYLGTPLVDAARLDDVANAVLDATLGSGAALFALEWVDPDGPVARAFVAAARRRGRPAVTFRTFRRAALRRRAEPTYLEGTVRGVHRKELRRLRRVLSRELGAELTLTDRARDPDAVTAFLDLEARGWKGAGTTALASDPTHAAWFREACAALADDGRLQLFALHAAGRAVAMKCNVVAGDTVFCVKIAHDEDLARRSPGVLLELDNVAAFHAGRAAYMDSCADADNAMINRLWPDRRSIATLLLPMPGWRGRLAALAAGGYTALRARVRRSDVPAADRP